MSADMVQVTPGHTPLLISMPHVGTAIPDALRPRYTERALASEDTDWFLDRLYAFATARGATVLVPHWSRYVVDLNRAPDDRPMYAGRNNTELCPTRHFTGDPIYREGAAPDRDEITRRVADHWAPYHTALTRELVRLQAQHGHVVLFDAHSIRSELPWLFEGRLPHLSLGTVHGASCAPALSAAVMAVLRAQSTFTHVLNGRFVGGHITRHYGAPDTGVHALQLEMAMRTYMDESMPAQWDAARAAAVTPLLEAMVDAMIGWRP